LTLFFRLIYARPDQTPAMGADELKLAIAEAAEHLSLYPDHREDTPFFGLHAAGKLKTPDEATARALYDVTQESVPCMAYRPTRSPTTRGRARSASQIISCTGARGICRIGSARIGRLDINGMRQATATDRRPEALADAGRGQRPWRHHRRSAQTASTPDVMTNPSGFRPVSTDCSDSAPTAPIETRPGGHAGATGGSVPVAGFRPKGFRRERSFYARDRPTTDSSTGKPACVTRQPAVGFDRDRASFLRGKRPRWRRGSSRAAGERRVPLGIDPSAKPQTHQQEFVGCSTL